jgi:hypothetical protein
MYPKTAILAAAVLFLGSFLYSRESAKPPEPGTETENALDDSGLASLPVIALFDAASGKSLDWRPDWPLFMPPDLFHAAGASLITVTIIPGVPNGKEDSGKPADEAVKTGSADAGQEQAEEISYSAEWNAGVPVRFPVFTGSAFIQGKAEYAASGVSRIMLGDAPDLDVEILDRDGENRPVLVRLFMNGEYFFSTLEYEGGGITETRYDSAGFPLRVISSGILGETFSMQYSLANGDGRTGANAAAEARKLFFNAQGHISGIETPEGNWYALYEWRGLPRYVEWKSAVSDENVPEETANYSFQWDENSRLVRLTGKIPQGRSDSRYEYRLDERGNWIERREIRMMNLAGRLFPVSGSVIMRELRYTPDGTENPDNGENGSVQIETENGIVKDKP